MKRWTNGPFVPAAVPRAAAMVNSQQPPQRVPQEFIEAMKRLTSDKSAENQQSRRSQGQSSVKKWKSSFKPIGDEEEECEDAGTGGSERLYDPYSPGMSDSEADPVNAEDRGHSPPSQEATFERQRLSPGPGCPIGRRWDSPYLAQGTRPLDEQEFSAGIRPAESRGPDPESTGRLGGYGSVGGPLDQRGCSPDRRAHGTPTQRFPPSYGGQRANEEEMLAPPEYRREMSTTVRLSPPRLPRDYKPPLPYAETGLNKDLPPENVTRSRSKSVTMDKFTPNPEQNVISCDLCDVVLANGQELDEHLDSKSHWDTLEHIQQNNNYDDMAIAFLQDVLLYKSHQCSRAIEDSALQALQENDHMTKVEMFHCAACKVFVYTSAAEVQRHITSREHLSNTKEFHVQQRRSCLSKAKTMMEGLQPQLELFLEGGSPFE